MARFTELLKRMNPRNGRIVAEDGSILNLASYLRQLPLGINRGQAVGYHPINAFGSRVGLAGETNYPIWPNGPKVIPAPYGDTLTVQSTSIEDAPDGEGIASLHLHYLRQDLSEADAIIELNGTTPVPFNDPLFHFMQCMHVETVGSNYADDGAAGEITFSGAVNIYSDIAISEVRCSSAFRMVPRGKRLFVDGAVGASVSGTASTRATVRMIANEIEDHVYTDPYIYIPHGEVGLQDNAIAFNFPGGLGPFQQGTIVGGSFTIAKDANISLSWYGRLEPTE